MSDDVKLPGMKKPANKYLVIGLGAVAAYVGYQWYKNRSGGSGSSAPTGAAAGGNDPFPWDGTTGNPEDPYSLDPNTGITYGNEGLSSGNFGGGGPGGGSGGSGGTSGPPFSNNSDWSNWVIQQLQTLDPNLNTGKLTAALGLYLAGQPVDPSQKTLILDAEAIGGPPPVAGPGGYPPKIKLNGHKGGGQNATNPVAGLHQTGSEGSTGADISWQPSDHATSYTVKSSHGTVAKTGATSARIRSIGPRHDSATVTVLANPAAAGAKPASIVVKVKEGGGGGGKHADNPVAGLHQSGHEGTTGADIRWKPSANATSYTVRSNKGHVDMTGKTSARIRDIGPHHEDATVTVLANPAADGARPASIHVKTK